MTSRRLSFANLTADLMGEKSNLTTRLLNPIRVIGCPIGQKRAEIYYLGSHGNAVKAGGII